MAKGDFDDILTNLGSGKWNFYYYLNLSLYGFIVASFILNGTYITPNVAFDCDTTSVQESVYNVEDCEYTILQNDTDGHEIEVTKQCDSWNYTDPLFPKSMTSQFDLVCKHSYVRPLYQTLVTIGSFVGDPVNGFLSDRYGRKSMITICSLVSVLSILLSTLANNFVTVLILRFITGLVALPAIQTQYTLCMEVCPPKDRTAVGIILALPWAIGTMWWGLLGYLIKDWRWLLRASTVPAILYFISLFFIGESPRWLIVSGYHEKALTALEQAAKRNHTTLPSKSDLLQQMQVIQKSSRRQSVTQENKKGLKNTIMKEIKQVFILLRTRELRRRTLLMYIVFVVSSTVFYGLSFSAVNLDLDPFMYMIVGGLMEVPAYTIVVPVIMKVGRMKFTAASYFICGTVILILAFIPSDPKWLIITLAMIGKFCISAAYQVIYLMATEVFPTEVRMQGLGTCGSISTLGSIAAPFITELIGAAYPWIPSLIFGGLSLLAGVATVFLPETMNQHLSETVMQLEQETMKKRYKIEDEKEKEEEKVMLPATAITEK